ncbi:hypothetical protein BKA70DRAFT_1282973 [Coprinopsis sp. MPI-PUGE-AT-0042]|nr:hypothetical protein BKA70DRAFT_1282973 [Coprinopsis sp. MPI-PUGE-AT-0042]
MTSKTVSLDEINYYGDTVAKAHYTDSTLTYIAFGVQLFMVVHGVSLFLESPKEHRKGRGKFILASIAIIATSALSSFFDGWKAFRLLYNGGPTGNDYMNAWRKDHERIQSSIATGIVGDTMLVTNIALGDALLLWRCLILWTNKKWMVALPGLTFVLSVVFGIIAIVPDSVPQLQNLTPVISTTLSVATNVLITFLILWRLIRARQRMAKLLPGHEYPSLYGGVITILVEAAVPLAVFGLCFAILTFVVVFKPITLSQRAALYSCADIAGALYYAFAAISPLMIIYRVTTGRSWKNGNESHQGAGTFTQPIKFVHTTQSGPMASFHGSVDRKGRSENEDKQGLEI